GRVGDGTHVAQLRPTQPGTTNHGQAHRDTAHPAPPKEALLSQRGQLLADVVDSRDLPGEYGRVGTGAFRVGQPGVAQFPYETWARLVAKHACRTLPSVATYQNAQGYLQLREAIAAHIGITRGVRCTAEQIVVTAGSQGALDLVARVLLDPGDAAWVE